MPLGRTKTPSEAKIKKTKEQQTTNAVTDLNKKKKK